MHARALLRSTLMVLSLLCLTACDNDDDDGTPAPAPQPEATQDVVVAPSLGKVVGGGAQAFDPAGNELSDEEDTGDDGFATLRIPASYAGPLLIRLRGKAGARYFDEATGEDEDFPEGQSFRAALPEPRASVGVSILTELAVRLAEASGQTLDAAAIEDANERIRAALAPEVADLLTAPALVDEDTAAGDLEDSEAGRLAARLGALARLATGDASPALAILQQLAADVEDGVIDGLDADGEAITTSHTPATFADDFVQAVQDFAGAFGDEALQTRAREARAETRLDADDGTDGGAGGGTGGETGDGNGQTAPGTVNAALVGSYTLTYFDESPSNASDPFSDEQEVSVTIASDGTLTIDSLVLTDPFNRFLGGTSPHLPEIIWLDPATNLEYALSDNENGTFNEINVGDASMPQGTFGTPSFLGQLREPAADDLATELVVPLAATFSNLIVIDACRSPSGDLCPNATEAASTVDVIIGNDATITIGSLMVDASAEGATVLDQRSSIEPRITVTVPGAATGESTEIDIYVDPALAGSSSVNGFRIREVRVDGGVGTSDGLTVELDELRSQFTDYFIGLTSTAPRDMPVRLTIVKEDDTYPSRMQQRTGLVTGTPLCRSFELSAEEDVMLSSGKFRQLVIYLDGEPTFEYTRAISRFRSAGPRWLSFQGGQLITNGGTLTLEEGFLSSGAGNFINAITTETGIRDAATNDATRIAEACADFAELTVTVTADGLTAGRLEIVDVAAGATVFSASFDADLAQTAEFIVGLPRDLDYEVTVPQLLLRSSPDQVCSTETVTLGSDQAVTIDCAAPAPPP